MRVLLCLLLLAGCAVEPVEPEPEVTEQAAEVVTSEPTEDATPGGAIEAGIFCERFLDQRSGPYEHGSYRDYTASYVDGVWRVAGALADGTPWACGVEPNADASEWTLVELELSR